MANILAVDDDPLILRCIDRILRREGHNVVQASHGSQALHFAQEQSFDVALVDYQLPSLDGLEVLTRLRDIQPGCLRILVTGRLDLPLVTGAVNRGEISRVVEKPFQSSTLVRAVKEALATRERMAEVVRVQEAAQSERERALLVECLEGGHLSLALQPIVRSEGHEIVAFEALLRSDHEVLNGPLAVLRAAERYDMVPEVAAEVARLAAEWLDRLPKGVQLFINLHPDELGEPEELVARLAPLAPRAQRVVLEITERSKLLGIERWGEAVTALTDMGFSLAVDDLGAGYSSLSVLAELHPRYVKVDMSIVRGVDSEPRKRRLVELLYNFAKATDALLVAEGVETAAEADTLAAIGVHLLQGYYFGRPSTDLPVPLRLAG